MAVCEVAGSVIFSMLCFMGKAVDLRYLLESTLMLSSGQQPKQEVEQTQLAFSLRASQPGRTFVIGLVFHM